MMDCDKEKVEKFLSMTGKKITIHQKKWTIISVDYREETPVGFSFSLSFLTIMVKRGKTIKNLLKDFEKLDRLNYWQVKEGKLHYCVLNTSYLQPCFDYICAE